MEYVSTRGGTRAVDFEGALFSGYAPDGGLFMPQRIPSLDRDTLQRWSSLSYPELVKELCSLFVPATLVPRNALNELIDRAFSRFRHKNVVHLSRLKDGLNVLELWHGVTYAFKDLSLSCTGQFLQYFLEKKQKHVNILVGEYDSLEERAVMQGRLTQQFFAFLVLPRFETGTSGDTGSSAIESVRGQKNVDIFVLLPKGFCTQIQELQMTTVIEDNIHVFTGWHCSHGNSDEIDEPIKELFADVDFAGKYNLMSLNSVNWSRIMVQIAHYFYAYFQCTPSLDTSQLPMVEIVVPTGGGGNITAGCIAQKMGLPVRLVTVVNSNDIIHRTIQHGDFSVAESVKATLASAMDIQEPYNVERILWLLSGSDSHLIKTLMEQFNISKRLKLPKDLHRKLSETLGSCSSSDQDIVGAMRRCWEENQYLLCPHSAVAAHYHYSQPHSIPRCCLAPASAAKFQDALLQAGLVPQIPPEITALTAMETRSTPLERGQDWAQVLRGRIEAVAQQWEAQTGQSAPQGR
ncbi:Threonine synthase-like 2 [Lonchura striata]|uniref:Threonine synthase-like 2 n=1 Tax=Lonchura striata TaxID=40157 RepID=A0A218V902_9PASE|nr:Threonine synthase-like 2 [Lonchura striata domestica]